MCGTAVCRVRASVAIPALPVDGDAELLEPEPLDERRAADADEHQVRLDRLALTEVDGEDPVPVLDLRALLAELERDPALAELLGELLGGVRVLHRDQRRQHLDDRHLGAEALEDRRELAADDPAAENDEALRHLLLGEQARSSRRSGRSRARRSAATADTTRRDDRLLEGDVLPALDRDRVRVLEVADTLHPLDAVRLEEARDPAGHLLDDRRLPLVRGRQVELRLRRPRPRTWRKLSSASFSAKAVCTHAFVGMQPTRRHVPPSSGSFSIQTARTPSCAARIAAV